MIFPFGPPPSFGAESIRPAQSIAEFIAFAIAAALHKKIVDGVDAGKARESVRLAAA
ncbi:MAG: hypothetical protein LBJ46_04055 [Planctomycetota bacterium]|jgi:hypothetical protein|nr:hypothetical protein [Planctomycetota bacterium]